MPFTDEQIKAFPSWLQKLVKMTPAAREASGYTDEDIEQAGKAYHLDKDYTTKSQKVAALEKIQEQYPDLSLDDAAKVWDWWQKYGQEVTEVWPHRTKIKEILARPAEAAPATGNGNRTTGTKRRWQDTEATDLYETARLREVFEDLETSASERAVKQVKDEWYEKEEKPRLDRVAAGYLSTVVDLVDFVQQETLRAARDPAYTPIPISEVLKEATARGERDFRKVAKLVTDERGTVKKSGFDEGYQKGIEDQKKAGGDHSGPSGPLGAAQPPWKPAPQATTPKTREDRAAAVITTVEKKYGQKLPL